MIILLHLKINGALFFNYCNMNRILSALIFLSLLASCSRSDKLFTTGNVSFKMIPVDGGSFLMGSQSMSPSLDGFDTEAQQAEMPTHMVKLKDYYIGETEVTQALWYEVMGKEVALHKGYSRPVESVSYNDICGPDGFLERLNKMFERELDEANLEFSLPSEAEWEFAARGGNKSKYYRYSGSNNAEEVAVFQMPNYWQGGSSSNVATKIPNELGIYDMSGNVWEWCIDSYNDYTAESQVNPIDTVSSADLRVVRGGGFDNVAQTLRTTARSISSRDYRFNNLGFRLAMRRR